MIFTKGKYTFLLAVLTLISCARTPNPTKKTKTTKIHSENNKPKKDTILKTGAEQFNIYLPLVKGKKIGIVANQTSIIKNASNQKKYIHLVDFLLAKNNSVIKVFSPEHGFRGNNDAGEIIKNGLDTKTGLPIISLYGKNKKPKKKELQNIDIILFDLQDVGVRFYTYISTLHYVMEACAENNIKLIVLDRPNPNAHYIDGPVLEEKFKSFIGMHPVPIVYGMTIGEYAEMINGENWLSNKEQCDLNVIPIKNYTHKTKYNLPVPPSPNLPNSKSINLYPSLCLFEGTTISVGRGTNKQFQIYGSPYLHKTNFNFTPKPHKGANLPKHKGKICYGESLKNTPELFKIKLSWLKKAFKETSQVKTKFWRRDNFFNLLAGNNKLKEQIINNIPEEQIKKSWQKDLEKFKETRRKYLLYK